MPDPNRHSARRSTRTSRAGVLLAIGGVVLVVLLCAGGLVFLNSQGAFFANLASKTNTPGATAKNSPSAIPTAVAAVDTATPLVPPVPSPTESATVPLTTSLTLQPSATKANPPATTVRPTAVSKTTKAPTAPPPPAASPSPVVAPGVYVTGMRIEPAQVMDGQYPKFFVTFWNNQDMAIPYSWFVKIFEPDKRQSFGEEAKVGNAIAPGTSTLPAATNWKAPGELPCRPFIARVYYVGQDNAVIEFSMPAGNPFLLDFKVCQ